MLSQWRSVVIVLAAVAAAACGAQAPAADSSTADDGAAAAPTGSDSVRSDSVRAGSVRADSTMRTGQTTADTTRAALLRRADDAVAAIAERRWSALAALAHPERGARFSPYGHVEPDGECTVTLTPSQLASLGSDTTTRCWGHFDGSGEPIRMTFADYYERFVYDRPYRGARRGAPDERLGQGNTLSNLPDAFGPGATFVEYHVPGTEEYDGMDWGGLRLVFVPAGGEWRLVGVVHDQWTI